MEQFEPPASSEALRARIVRRHAVRLHCALILIACFATGLLVTKLMLMAGVSAMWIRYALALVAAYAVFLLGVRVWLRYAGLDGGARRAAGDTGAAHVTDVIGDVPAWRGSGAPAQVSDVLRGGGGRSGGAGVSMSLDGSAKVNVAVAGMPESASASSAGSGARGSGGGFGLDVDGGLVFVALVLAVAAVAGAAIYVVWAAPTILADAAFAAMLSAGLVRPTRRIVSGDWMASVLGNTWIAFFAVAILAIGFALVAQHVYPQARTLPDVLWHLRHAPS